jgi:hypothetical protein
MSRTLVRTAVGQTLRGLWLAAVVAVGLPSLVSAFARQPALGLPSDEDAAAPAAVAWEDRWRRDAAADLADRARARFRETLDFEPLMDEFFVEGVGRRNSAAGLFGGTLRESEVAPELVAALDEADLRRGYVAMLNFTHLHSAYALAESLEGEGGGEFPPAVAAEIAASPCLRAMLDDDGAAPRIETRDDYLRLVAELESVGDAYRRLVTAGTFDSPAYAANLARLDEADAVLDVASDGDTGYTDFGVAEGARVYEVRRDAVHWYSVVEEGGSFRIVTVGAGGD